jgi:CubicO group peptidase (beta-lactamase class C family)
VNSFLFTNNFDALILGYQNSKVAQDELAKAIFGGIGMSGRLPVSTKHYNINSGLMTQPIRMNYVSPEEIDFSANLLYKIDSIVKNSILERATPGCQILIARNRDIFFNRSYGFHTYEKRNEVKDADIYDLASITKIGATVPMLMQMVDSKALHLDAELGDYLNLASTDKSNLIIRDILSHQARLFPWIPFYKRTLVKDSASGVMSLRDTLYSTSQSERFPHKVAEGIYLHQEYPDSIMQQVKDSELLDKKEYRYSDLGYYFFKEIIEQKYSKTLNEIVNEKFYKGLGMENMGYLPLERINESRIIPTESDFEFRSQLLKGNVHDMGAAMQGGIGGHAGLFSNANDLAKLMQMYLQKGEYAGERYLTEEVVEEFTKCQFCIDENRRGAGFDKPVLEGEEGGATCQCVSSLSFGHSGFTGTLAWVDPKEKIIYIFLSNRIHPDASNKKLLDMDVRTEIMQVIYNSLNEK